MADRVLVDFPSMEYADLESFLRDSTSRFLAAVSAAPNPDLTNFRSIFLPVLNAYLDPPLEAVWFFSAVTFQYAPDDVRSILRLLSSFAVSSHAAAKPLALLAPVVSELFHSTKPRRKIEALVEDVLSYISTCSSRPAGGEVNAESQKLLPVFGELVKVWNVRNSRGRCPFQVLFPLVGNEAREELMKEGCSVTFLAEVVVAEVFLLRLCLKVQGAVGVPEMQNDLRIWAASSILEYPNQQFSGVLLNMLANPPMPVHPLLSVDAEILLRDVLYDTLILVDYSSLSAAEVDQADSSLLPIFVSRLVIIVDAINNARSQDDQEKEMLYINAFSTSNIPCYLIRWVILQARTDLIGKLIAWTPQAFLEWLVDLEDKGLKVFGENYSRIKERLMQGKGKQSQKEEGMYTKGGEDEEAVEMETADNASMAAAHSVEVMGNSISKTKDCGTEDATVVKFVKYKIQDANGMSSGGWVCPLVSRRKD